MEQITISRAEYNKLKSEIAYLNDTVKRLDIHNSIALTPEQVSQETELNVILIRNLMKKGYIASLRIGKCERTTRGFLSDFYYDFKNYDL